MSRDPLFRALKPLVEILDGLHIRYFIGGSIASSARGVVRATFDVDIVARIHSTQVSKLVEALGPDWYADPDTMRDAIALDRSFNIVFIPDGQKVDVFPLSSEFQMQQLERATPFELVLPGGTVVCPVATAEDMLLAKLLWYRTGGCVSDRQWSDITGIIAISPEMDNTYVDGWARKMRLTDLLATARADAAA